MNSSPSSAWSALSDTIRKDPFRLFFPVGILLAAIGIVPWTAFFFDVALYPAEFHRLIMMNGFMLSFVCGFLMTAIPRFTASTYVTDLEWVLVFLFLVSAAMLSTSSSIGYSYLSAALAQFVLIVFGVKRFKQRQTNPPFTFIFVASGLLLWTLSNVFLFLQAMNVKFAVETQSIWRELFASGAVMALVLGVGGRLIPGILGLQEIVATQKLRYEKPLAMIKVVPPLLWVLLGIYVLSFLLVNVLPMRWYLLMRALVVWYFGVVYWRLYKIPKDKSYLTWCVWAAGWCFLIGPLLALYLPEMYVHVMHTIFIGGFSLLTLLVATRVTLAHSDEGTKAERSLKSICIVTALLLFAALTRVTAIMIPKMYISHLGYAAVTWLSALLIWAWFMVPRMLRGKHESV